VEPVEPVALKLAAAELQLATMPACRLRAKIAAAGVNIGGRSGDVEPMKERGCPRTTRTALSHTASCATFADLEARADRANASFRLRFQTLRTILAS
jgi:hypothetical protein